MSRTHLLLQSGQFGDLQVAVAEMQGRRPSMEDAVCCAQVQEGSTLLGIFDGHGGGLCAELTSKLLPSMVHLFLRQPLSLEDVMHQSFRYMDLLLQRLLPIRDDRSGCTATCVLLTPSQIVVANLGDSRTLVMNDMSLLFQTRDHSTDDPAERARAMSAGAFFTDDRGTPRLNGRLNLTRSLGDFQDKEIDILHDAHAVGNVPDVTVLPRTSPLLLFMGCDGMFETMSSLIIKKITQAMALSGCANALFVAHQLVNKAFFDGSMDNLSALVAFAGTPPADASKCRTIGDGLRQSMSHPELLSQTNDHKSFEALIDRDFPSLVVRAFSMLGKRVSFTRDPKGSSLHELLDSVILSDAQRAPDSFFSSVDFKNTRVLDKANHLVSLLDETKRAVIVDNIKRALERRPYVVHVLFQFLPDDAVSLELLTFVRLEFVGAMAEQAVRNVEELLLFVHEILVPMRFSELSMTEQKRCNPFNALNNLNFDDASEALSVVKSVPILYMDDYVMEKGGQKQHIFIPNESSLTTFEEFAFDR